VQLAVLQQKVDGASVEWGNGFNYLAIGNSITKHNINEYWCNEVGMAASTAENDYFHLVLSDLESSDVVANDETITGFAFNGAAWEVQTNDRSEVLGLWDDYLSDKLDLVTIQLSENVSDTTTFEADFHAMVEYVMKKCPNAQIIVIDDFLDNKKSEMKQKAIEGLKVDFVDLSEIRGKSEYQAGLGTVVYDANGKEHIIEHSGVAKHPGDKGMMYYAEQIIKLLKNK